MDSETSVRKYVANLHQLFICHFAHWANKKKIAKKWMELFEETRRTRNRTAKNFGQTVNKIQELKYLSKSLIEFFSNLGHLFHPLDSTYYSLYVNEQASR